MKQMIVLAIAILSIISCNSRPTESPIAAPAAEPKGTGYTEENTQNVTLLKQANEAAARFDTTALRGFYRSGTDTIHNNLESMTVDQNIGMTTAFQKSGLTFTVGDYFAIWETTNYKANDKGVTNYVMSYCMLNVKKGDKTVPILFHQVMAFKDNKVVEEWDVYDTKALTDLMK